MSDARIVGVINLDEIEIDSASTITALRRQICEFAKARTGNPVSHRFDRSQRFTKTRGVLRCLCTVGSEELNGGAGCSVANQVDERKKNHHKEDEQNGRKFGSTAGLPP
ncbi:MAG: hypothetical protein C0507_13975 [Cyanobacteria bacterium PR.3.49]|nr:hypothetical protein [Cyanobacteria bacterium PR.3.49]